MGWWRMKTSNCVRCGRLCQLAERSGTGQPIRKSDVGGCCVDCAITCFARTSPLGEVLGGGSSAPNFTLAEALRLPHVKLQFAAVFKAGGCVEAGQEVDWERVIANWDLEIPEGWDWRGELYMSGKRSRRQ